MLAMEWQGIDPHYQALLDELGLNSFRAVEAYFPISEALDRYRVVVIPGQLQSENGSSHAVFYKQYRYPQARWRDCLRPSKARREWDNYETFRRLGIRCPDRIAWGEQRDRLGRLRRAFIITRAVPRGQTLLEFLRDSCPHRRYLSQARGCQI